MAHAVPLPRDVALFDSLGRFVRCTTDGTVCTVDVCSEDALLHVLPAENNNRVVISAKSGGFLGLDPATSSFKRVTRLAATLFTRRADGGGDGAVSFTFEAAGGATLYLACTPDGGALVGVPHCTVFTRVEEPLMGLVCAVHATRAMDGRSVCLWSRQGGWVSAEPPHHFLGGRVLARVANLGEWEIFGLTVVDPDARVVGLKSCHGYWVCHRPSGSLDNTATALNEWEKFTLKQVGPWEVALVSHAHNNSRAQYVSSSSEVMDCTSASAQDPPSRFVLLDGEAARKRYAGSNPSGLRRAETEGERVSQALTTALGAVSVAGLLVATLAAAGDAQTVASVVGAVGAVGAAAVSATGTVFFSRPDESVAEAMRTEVEQARAEARLATERADAAAIDASLRADVEERVRDAVGVVGRETSEGPALLVALVCIEKEARASVAARRAAVDFGGLGCIVSGVRRLEADAAVSAAGFRAFLVLSTMSNGACIITPGAVSAALRAVRLHVDDVPTLTAALDLVCHLGQTSEGRASAMQESGAETCVGALRLGEERDEMELVASALRAVGALMRDVRLQAARVANAIVASNGLAVLNRVLGRDPVAPLAVVTLSAELVADILAASEFSVETVDRFQAAGLLETVLDACTRHSAEELVVLHCLRTLRAFSQAGLGAVHNLLVHSGAPARLLHVQARFPTSAALASYWAELYAGLAESGLALPECGQAAPLMQTAMRTRARDATGPERAGQRVAEAAGARFYAALRLPVPDV